MEHNEDNRLKKFRQLKRVIRGSQEHPVVGIDIAKEKHHAFFGMPTGKTLFRRLVFENTKEGNEWALPHILKNLKSPFRVY